MKNIIKTLPVLLAVFLLSAGFISLDDKSEAILKKSQSKLENLKDFSATFSYEISSITHRTKPIAKQGHFKYKKGKFVINLEDQAIYCDGNTQWVYIPDEDGGEVNIMEYDPEEGINVESIFNIYQSSASSRYDGMVNGNKQHKIYLALKDNSLDYNQAYLWINAKTHMLEKATLVDRKQTKTVYEFSNIQTDVGYEDAVFRFDESKHPGVMVYDER